MSAKILSFFRPAPGLRDDWSQQELAEFYRVEAATVQAGLRIVTDRGVSDEGDPWFVFCRVQDESVFLHIARINGLYWIAGDGIPTPLRGPNFRALLSDLTRSHPTFLPIPPQTGGAKVLLHPGALLAAIVATACLLAMPREALASEAGAAPDASAPLSGAGAGAAGGGEAGAAFIDPYPAEVADADRRATIAGLALLAASVALSMPDPSQILALRGQGWLLGGESQGSGHGKADDTLDETGLWHGGDLDRRAPLHTAGQAVAADGGVSGAAGLWPTNGMPRTFGSGGAELFQSLAPAGVGPGSLAGGQAHLDLRGIDLHELSAGAAAPRVGEMSFGVLLSARMAQAPAKAAAATADGHTDATNAPDPRGQTADAAPVKAPSIAATGDAGSVRSGTGSASAGDLSAGDATKAKPPGSGSTDPASGGSAVKAADTIAAKPATLGSPDGSVVDATKTDIMKMKVGDFAVTALATTKVVVPADGHSALAQIGDGLTSGSQDALRKAGLALPDAAVAGTTTSAVGSSASAPSQAMAAPSPDGTTPAAAKAGDGATKGSDGLSKVGDVSSKVGDMPSKLGDTAIKVSDAALGSASTTAKAIAVASSPASGAAPGSVDHPAGSADAGSGIAPSQPDPSLRPLDATQLQLINSFIANTPHLGATLVDHTLLLFDTVPVIGSSAQVTSWDLGGGSRLEIVGLSNVVHI